MDYAEMRAQRAIEQYQMETRRMQLLAMAEMALTREEAQRCLAEAAMLGALTTR